MAIALGIAVSLLALFYAYWLFLPTVPRPKPYHYQSFYWPTGTVTASYSIDFCDFNNLTNSTSGDDATLDEILEQARQLQGWESDGSRAGVITLRRTNTVNSEIDAVIEVIPDPPPPAKATVSN